MWMLKTMMSGKMHYKDDRCNLAEMSCMRDFVIINHFWVCFIVQNIQKVFDDGYHISYDYCGE